MAKQGKSFFDLSDFGDAIDKANKLGDTLRKKEIERIQSQTNAMAMALMRAQGTAAEASARKQLIAYQRSEQQQLQTFKKNLDDKMGLVEDFNKKSRQGMVATAEAFGDSLDTAIMGAFNKDFAGLGKKLFAGIGGKMQGKGAAMQADAGAAGDVSKMGRSIEMLGKAAMGIAATVGIIAVVGKLLLDADSKAKEWNKTLMSGSAAGSMLTGTNDDLASSLQRVRREVDAENTGGGLLGGYRLLNGQVLEVTAAFNQAGMTMEEQEKQIGGVAAVAEKAIRLGNVWGKGHAEMAKEMQQHTETLGMDLNSVDDALTSIYGAAKLSGFEMQRFYTMVQMSVSNLEGYNVSIERSAELLTTLSKTMSPRQAGEFLQTLNKGFRDMDVLGRVKQTVFVGAGKMQRLNKLSIEEKANQMLKTAPGIGDAMGVGGVSTGKDLSSYLSGLTPAQRRETLMRVQKSGKLSKDQQRMFQDTLNASQGLNASGAGQVGFAAKDMTPGATLAAKMAETKRALGVDYGDMLDPKNWKQAAAAQSSMGKSGEEMEQLGKLTQQLKAEFEDQKGSGKYKTLEEYIIQSGSSTVKELADQSKTVEEQRKEQEKLAKDAATATVSSMTMFEKMLESLQERIAPAVEEIVKVLMKWFGGDNLSTEDRRSRNKYIGEQQEIVGSSRSELESLGTQLSKAKTPQEKADILAKIQGHKDAMSLAQGKIGVAQGLQQGPGEGGTWDALATGGLTGSTKTLAKAAGYTFKSDEKGGAENVSMSMDGEVLYDFADTSKEAVVLQTKQKKEAQDYYKDMKKDIPKTFAAEFFNEQEKRQTDALVGSGVKAEEAAKTVQSQYLLPKKNDFIYRNDGSITPIDTADKLFNIPGVGFMGAKPGGGVSKGLGSKGSGMVVTIHVTGTNEREIFNGVVKALKEIER